MLLNGRAPPLVRGRCKVWSKCAGALHLSSVHASYDWSKGTFALASALNSARPNPRRILVPGRGGLCVRVCVRGILAAKKDQLAGNGKYTRRPPCGGSLRRLYQRLWESNRLMGARGPGHRGFKETVQIRDQKQFKKRGNIAFSCDSGKESQLIINHAIQARNPTGQQSHIDSMPTRGRARTSSHGHGGGG